MNALPTPATRLHGALTIASSQSQHGVLTPAVEVCLHELVLDLSEVEAVDSAGVQLLLAARRSLAARGATLRLRAVPQAVVDMLELYGLQAVLPWGGAPAGASENRP